jgi:hypothetical protein
LTTPINPTLLIFEKRLGFSVSKTPHATAYAKFYPRGYTGEIGVWQKYFLPVHVDQYKNVMTKYLDLMPNADLFKKLYPDIGL